MGTKANPRTLRLLTLRSVANKQNKLSTERSNSNIMGKIDWYSHNYSFNLLKDIRRYKYIQGALEHNNIEQSSTIDNSSANSLSLRTPRSFAFVTFGTSNNAAHVANKRSLNSHESILVAHHLANHGECNALKIATLVGQIIQNAKSPETAFKKVANMLGQRLIKQDLRNSNNPFMGLKIRSAGRFNGALMAKSITLSYGKMPLQSISVDIDYDQIAVITKYGLQSISVWLAINNLAN